MRLNTETSRDDCGMFQYEKTDFSYKQDQMIRQHLSAAAVAAKSFNYQERKAV